MIAPPDGHGPRPVTHLATSSFVPRAWLVVALLAGSALAVALSGHRPCGADLVAAGIGAALAVLVRAQ